MNLKELYHLRNSLIDLWDFASNHLDGDQTNLTNEMHEHYDVLSDQHLNLVLTKTNRKNGKLSEESKRKISKAHTGRKHSVEARKRMSESKKGKSANNKGNDRRCINQCVVCGKEYKTYVVESKFCNKECRSKRVPHNKGKSKREPRECDWCSAIYRPKKDTHKFCSRSCASFQKEKNKKTLVK